MHINKSSTERRDQWSCVIVNWWSEKTTCRIDEVQGSRWSEYNLGNKKACVDKIEVLCENLPFKIKGDSKHLNNLIKESWAELEMENSKEPF